MDHQQWRNQQHQPSAKVPKLQNKSTKMGSLFSWEQWQELELQVLIYKYMLAGALVPLELIIPLKRGLVSSSPCYPYDHHFQPAMVQGGYWGRHVLEPEPGRCQRTDGKKWRCSRDVVDSQKYCERHVHRGRNRSRKHVEIPTPTPQSCSGFKASPLPSLEEKRKAHFTLPESLSSAPNILSLHLGCSDDKMVDGFYCSKFSPPELQENRPNSQVLMPFFDDWPKSEHEPSASNKNIATSTTSAYVFDSMPDNSFSDFSLKLSTGNGDKQPRVQTALSNRFGWENLGETSMGGLLAEALRSFSSSSVPLPNASVSETSSAAT